MTHSISETIDDAMIALAESVASIDAAACSNIEKREALTETFAQFSDFLKANAKANNMNPDEDADQDAGVPDSKFVVGDGEQSNSESVIDPLIARHVAVLRTVRPDLTNEEAMRILIQTPRGRQLSAHLRDISKQDRNPVATVEGHMTKLKKYAATHGVAGIAAEIVKSGTALSEHQISDLIMEAAKRDRRPNESVHQAFARLYSDANVWKAIQIAKDQGFAESAQQRMKAVGAYEMATVDVKPVSTVVGDTSVADDSEAAYQRLMQMAERLARSAPYKSVSQHFADLFADQRHASLAAAAHRRPGAVR
jgi:hypothetical protein